MTPAQADPAAAGLDAGKDGDGICPPSPSPLPAPPPPPPPAQSSATASASGSEELECKICYQRYNSHNRRPKLLPCLHRVCSRCLGRMLSAGGEAQACLPCPFCRHETLVSRYQVARLPDDANIMSRLAAAATHRDSKPSARPPVPALEQRRNSCEVVLTPRSLASSSASSPSSPGPSFHGSDSTTSAASNCLVITIMEVQAAAAAADLNRRDSSQPPSPTSSGNYYYPAIGTGGEPSLDSVSVGSAGGGGAEQDALAKLCNNVPRVLVWLLGFFYFGSLPLGIYLLVIQRVTLGIVCVSLVPSSLTVCLVYGFCQCLCQGMCDCSSRG